MTTYDVVDDQSTGAAGADRGPSDVLLIYVDQWRWDALGMLGSQAQTPHLDALAAGGVHFDRAFVQSPVCMPSRVSLLTGRYPSDLRITRMGVPVPTGTETLADVVGARGWRTACFGKLHFQPHANRDHADAHPRYGFDVLAVSDEPGVYEDDYRTWVRAVEPAAVATLSSGLPPAARTWRDTMGPVGPDTGTEPARDDYAGVREFTASPDLTHTAWVATRTIAHLDALPEAQPAFTVAGFFSPHPPFHVPPDFLDRYDRAALRLPTLTAAEQGRQREQGPDDDRLRAVRHGYYAAITEVDHHVGRMLAALDRLGRTDRTLVVFVADHGEWLGDHLRFSKGYPASDPVSRVPLILRWPHGTTDPGRRVTTIVEALDVAPTVLAALGLPVPRTMQGRSLLPALRAEPLPGVELAVTEHDGWRSVRTPGFRYLVHADGTERLWDVSVDPTDEDDLAGSPSHAAVLAEHRRLLLQRMLRSERPTPPTWAY